MTPVQAFVDGLVAVAARRWRVPAGDDRVREWQGELHALRHEPGVPPAVRAYRQVAFALSLAVSRPAPSQGPAGAALETLWGLVGALRPVLVLLAVPGVAIGFMQGCAEAARSSVLGQMLAYGGGGGGGPVGAFQGRTIDFWIGLAVLGSALSLAAGVFSRSWSAADSVHRRMARLVVAPTLLSVGALLTPRPPVPGAALAACAVVLAGAGLWADRIGGAWRLLVLAPAGAAVVAVLFVSGQGIATMTRGDVRTPAVTLAVAVFAVRCAAATTRRAATGSLEGVVAAVPVTPAATAVGHPPAGVMGDGDLPAAPATHPSPPATGGADVTAAAGVAAARRVALATAVVSALAGVAVLVLTATGDSPISAPGAGVWAGWLTAIRQAAVVLIGAGLVQVVAVHRRTRLTEDRRRRVSIAVAVVSACCIPGLLDHARWNWIAVEAAPPGLVPATAILTGALAAVCVAGAVTARRQQLRAGVAGALIAGFAAFAAAAGSLSGGDADIDPLVLTAYVLGGGLPVPLLLTGRRIMLGRRPGRVRRTLLWTVAVVAILATSATQVLSSLSQYADNIIEPNPRLHGAVPSVPGTVLAALVLAAFLGRQGRQEQR